MASHRTLRGFGALLMGALVLTVPQPALAALGSELAGVRRRVERVLLAPLEPVLRRSLDGNVDHVLHHVGIRSIVLVHRVQLRAEERLVHNHLFSGHAINDDLLGDCRDRNERQKHGDGQARNGEGA